MALVRGRTKSDDRPGPTDAQRRYDEALPPALRYGALKRRDTPRRSQTVDVVEYRSPEPRKREQLPETLLILENPIPRSALRRLPEDDLAAPGPGGDNVGEERGDPVDPELLAEEPESEGIDGPEYPSQAADGGQEEKLRQRLAARGASAEFIREELMKLNRRQDRIDTRHTFPETHTEERRSGAPYVRKVLFAYVADTETAQLALDRGLTASPAATIRTQPRPSLRFDSDTKSGTTTIARSLARKEALLDLSLPFEEKPVDFIVQKALTKEQLDEVVNLSKIYVKSDEERVERLSSHTISDFIVSQKPHSIYTGTEERERFLPPRARHRRYPTDPAKPWYARRSDATYPRKDPFHSPAGVTIAFVEGAPALKYDHAVDSTGYKATLVRVYQSSFNSTNGHLGAGDFVIPQCCNLYASALGSDDPNSTFFNWLHIQQAYLDYGKFLDGLVSRISDSRLGVKAALEKFLRSFQSECEVLEPVRHMRPRYRQKKIEMADSGPPVKFRAACIPFTHLREMAADSSLHFGSTAHPRRTLLQTLHQKSDVMRDENQVAARLHRNGSSCLYVSQLWLVSVDEEFLATGCVFSRDVLSADIIDCKVSPSSSGKERTHQIEISTPEHSLYILDRGLCATWLAFAAHFQEITPYPTVHFRLQHDGGQVQPEAWETLLDNTKGSLLRLKLTQLQSGDAQEFTVKLYEPAAFSPYYETRTAVSVLQSIAEGIESNLGSSMFRKSRHSGSVPSDAMQNDVDQDTNVNVPFQQWAIAELKAETAELQQILASRGGLNQNEYELQISSWCSKLKEFSEASFDTRCKPVPSRPSQFFDHVNENEITHCIKLLDNPKSWYHQTLHFIQNVIRLFSAHDGSSTLTEQFSKLLEGVLDLIRSLHKCPDCNRRPLIRRFVLTREMQAFGELISRLLSYGVSGDTVQQDSPLSFMKAIWHTNCMIVFATKLSEDLTRNRHLQRSLGSGSRQDGADLEHLIPWGLTQSRVDYHAVMAAHFLDLAYREVLQARFSATLRSKHAVLPRTLMALLCRQAYNLAAIDGKDMIRVYTDYVNDLDLAISSGKAGVAPLDQLRYLKQEFNAISILQTHQADVTREMERAFTEDLKQQGINDTKQTGKRKDTLDIRDIELTVANHAENAVTARSAQYDQDLAIIQETLDTLLVKQQTLEDLDGYVPELEEETRQRVAETEDWRNNAGVVFTVVTILFLPPSFVASIFGMNTSDIRNMHLHQGIYWLVAALVTLGVVGFTLYWVDVPPVERWLKRTLPKLKRVLRKPKEMPLKLKEAAQKDTANSQ